MDNYAVSLIRTWVPIAVGAALTWLATRVGIVVDEQTSAGLLVVAVGVVTAAYYALARAVEHHYPGLGRILVALGLGKAAPTYGRGVDQPSRPPRM